MTKLSIKIKAVAILAGMIVGGALGFTLADMAVETYGIQAVGNVCVAGVMAYMLYLVYGLIVLRLEMDEKLDALSKKD